MESCGTVKHLVSHTAGGQYPVPAVQIPYMTKQVERVGVSPTHPHILLCLLLMAGCQLPTIQLTNQPSSSLAVAQLQATSGSSGSDAMTVQCGNARTEVFCVWMLGCLSCLSDRLTSKSSIAAFMAAATAVSLQSKERNSYFAERCRLGNW